MHYQVHGSGTPLVLLHGLGSSCLDWEYQIPAFAPHYRVVVPSLRGFGETEKPPGPHSVKTWSEDVLALLDHLELPACHLLGFSMGGAIAFQIAVDRQERLRSLMILNSQPSFELDHWRKNLMVLTRVGMARLAGMPRLARYVAKRMFPRADQIDLRQRMIDRHSLNDRDSYLNAVYALAGWSVQDRIGNITVPTLILAADQDYTPMEEKEIYVKLMPNARLAVIEDSRHVSHIDQSAALNRIVLDFLREIDGTEVPKSA